MRRLLILSLFAVSCYCDDFTIPEARLEFLRPTALKISIPDVDPDVSLVAFHVNINEEFLGVEHGQWAADIHKKRNGRWTYFIRDFRVKQGDTVFYWVYAIKNGLGFQNLDRSFKVTENNPHGPWTTESPTTMTESPTTTTEFDPFDPLIDMRISDSSVRTKRDQPPCSGCVLFNTNFHSTNDLDKWDFEKHIGGPYLVDEFTVFTKNNDVTKVMEDHLIIRPTLLEQKYPKGFLSNGSLTFDECTVPDKQYCRATAFTYMILPPVMSARLNTKKSFSFRYGTVEIKAKLPKGDWIVPELWLEPKEENYEEPVRIIMGLSRGNKRLVVAGKSIANNKLEVGVLLNSYDSTMFQKTKDGSWSEGYHLFKLVWTPEYMEFSVDNEVLGRLAPETPLDSSLGGKKMAPFDKEFFITLGVHVAGLRDFPDIDLSGNTPKPWKNTEAKARLRFWQAKDTWLPSWDQDSALFVEYVRVTAL